MDPEGHDPIGNALRQLPVWEPPAGFAHTVGARGGEVIRTQPQARRWSWVSLHVVTSAVLAGTAVFVAAGVLDLLISPALPVVAPTPEVMWMWVAFAYILALAGVRPLTRS